MRPIQTEEPKVEPVKAGDTRKRKPTLTETDQSNSTRKVADLVKTDQPSLISAEYKSKWKPIEPKDDWARPIQKEVKVDKDNEEAK